MEDLSCLLQNATQQFQSHHFLESLSFYRQCLLISQKKQLSTHFLNNLKTTVAAIEVILGNYDEALRLLNTVLENQRYHWLGLLRRSQVYKKMGKYKKALKDIEKLKIFCPDNLHVVALKIQIESLIKMKGEGSSEESEVDISDKQMGEEEALKFSGLKKIDRTSVSVIESSEKLKQVTLSGETLFQYEEEQKDQPNLQPKKEMKNIEKFIETNKQIKEDEYKKSDQSFVEIKAKDNFHPQKSIFKNKKAKILIGNSHFNEANRLSLVGKIKNIDGKVLQRELKKEKKQVDFRSSLLEQPGFEIQIIKKEKSKKRKSCLKRTSFDVNFQIENNNFNRSKFSHLKRESIDGKIIQSQSSFKMQSDKQNESKKQSDEGSQYNIYGNQKITISKEVRETFGISSDDDFLRSLSNTSERKPSIMKSRQEKGKKISIFGMQQEERENKTKKSVGFSNS